MKILYVITELYEGGAEHALEQVVKGIHCYGHKSFVVCLYGGQGEVAKRLQKQKITVISLHVNKAWNIYNILQLRKIIFDFSPDLVHSWLFHANVFSRFLIPRTIPLICGLRVKEPRLLHIFLDRWTASFAKHFVCVSPSVQEFATTSLRIELSRCSIIENGVNYDTFASSRNATRIHHTLHGLTVARITPQKGIDILLKALGKFPSDVNWKWIFVGNHPEPKYADSLYSLTKKLNIADRICWLGKIPRDQIADYYCKANLFVLPSRWEGQPNVIFEAMASGVPIISAKTDGVKDILALDPLSMTVVEGESPVIWKNAILSLHNDVQRQQKQVMSAFSIAKKKSWEQATEAYVKLYNKILT